LKGERLAFLGGPWGGHEVGPKDGEKKGKRRALFKTVESQEAESDPKNK